MNEIPSFVSAVHVDDDDDDDQYTEEDLEKMKLRPQALKKSFGIGA